MKVSISEDQYGLELSTDQEFRDHRLDLSSWTDLIDIRNAIEDYLDKKSKIEKVLKGWRVRA